MDASDVKEAKIYPISDIIFKCTGDYGQKNGSNLLFSSPFSADNTPSLCVFKNNTYWDFSNGFGGDSIDMYMRLNNCSFIEAVKNLTSSNDLEKIETFFKNKSEHKKLIKNKKPFNKFDYITKKEDEEALIKKYAESRSIHEGYYPSAIITKDKDNNTVRKLAMMYVHVDENLNECGGKFRFIDNEDKKRFTARGELVFYILENIIENHYSKPILYFVESESSANSLYEILKKNFISGVVLSIGGQTNKFESIPKKYENIEKRKLIFDYDGNEEKYNKIIDMHKEWGEPVKLPLNKGQDLNTIFNEKKDNLIYKLLI
jgi:hypothetical protein